MFFAPRRPPRAKKERKRALARAKRALSTREAWLMAWLALVNHSSGMRAQVGRPGGYVEPNLRELMSVTHFP